MTRSRADTFIKQEDDPRDRAPGLGDERTTLASRRAVIERTFARHLPGIRVESMAVTAEGCDNTVYEVNGGLIIRLSKQPDRDTRTDVVTREVAVLDAVRRISPVRVPEVVFADAPEGLFCYRKLSGVPLFRRPIQRPESLADQLAEFLNSIHRITSDDIGIEVPSDRFDPSARHSEAETAYRAVLDHLSVEARRLVEEFLASRLPPASEAAVFCHNDLGAEHILVDEASGLVSGVIDWTDAAIGDPAYDLALIYRDLGPAIYERVVRRYDSIVNQDALARVVFLARCALLEDLSFGIRHGAARYVDASLAHLEKTFS